jgi:hypothetical protein
MFFFSIEGIHVYSIEAYISPEKYWLVCVGLLAAHQFNFHFISLSDSLPGGGRMSKRSCGCILPLTGLIRGDGQT